MEQIWRDWSMYEASLKPVSVLGRGSYGSVTLMEDSQLRAYAKKASPMELLNNLQKELNIMLRFHNHPCIVRATSPLVHFENNTNGERVCYIYMEYAHKRTLEKMMTSEEFRGKPLPEYIIQRVARLILQGLEALHANGYVHCDLKPANILLFHSTTYGEPFDLKLADFGLSEEPNSDSASLSGYKPRGTHLYMSPESFEPDIPIDAPTDIWSLGCVVYEMFGGKATRDIFEDYYDWFLVEEISPVAKDFLRKCHEWHSRRATATELLKHPFITQKLTPPLLPIIRQDKLVLKDWMIIPKLPGSIW